jgi:hypothetical protein
MASQMLSRDIDFLRENFIRDKGANRAGKIILRNECASRRGQLWLRCIQICHLGSQSRTLGGEKRRQIDEYFLRENFIRDKGANRAGKIILRNECASGTYTTQVIAESFDVLHAPDGHTQSTNTIHWRRLSTLLEVTGNSVSRCSRAISTSCVRTSSATKELTVQARSFCVTNVAIRKARTRSIGEGFPPCWK